MRARSNWNLKVLVFKERGKTRVLGEQPLLARERTNNKHNPHMASMPGFEPGPHWWEASALTNAPLLLPLIPLSGIVHKEKKVVGTHP